jgi:outer membrane protein OmpA-like peptidoglycan-associated protein
MKNAWKIPSVFSKGAGTAARWCWPICTALLLACATTVLAQKPAAPAKPKDLKKSGDLYFKQREYHEAVPFYLKYQLAEPQDFGVKYHIGQSYYHLDSLDRALAYFRYVLQDEGTPDEVYRYLAKCYAAKDNYETAARYLKLYLGTLDPRSPERARTKTQILQYIHALQVRARPTADVVQNLGPKINTRYDEWMPVFHPTEPNALYFTSRRAANYGPVKCPDRAGPIGECYPSDVYRAQLERGTWDMPGAAIFGLNSVEEEVLFGFGGKKGGTAWFYRGRDLVKGNWFAPEIAERKMPDSFSVAPLPFNALGVFEGNLAAFGESLVLFASERPGGYGGKDLWFSRRYPDGSWLEPQNLGPEVNTPDNEDCPYLAPDGRTLYFSSDRAESMGGYDIFCSEFIDATGLFQAVENLGYPINSPADDRDFRLGPQASSGYFASDRTGGMGGSDLYEIYFRPVRPAQQVPRVPATFVDVLLPMPPSMAEEPVAPQPAPKPNAPKPPPTPAPQPPVQQAPAVPPGKAPLPEALPADVAITKHAPIYFDKKTSHINPASYAQIELVAQFAKRHPYAQLLVVAHSDSTADPLNRELYLCLKQAELVAQKLVEAGVDKKQLVLTGVGPYYPFTRYAAADGQRNIMAGMMNSRVEIWCRSAAALAAKNVLACEYPAIVPPLYDPRGAQFSEQSAGLLFRIQVGSAVGEFKDPVLGRYPGPFAEAPFGSSAIQYGTGLFYRFAEARAAMDKWRNEGFNEAVVVAYYRHQRLTREQAEGLQAKFPELAGYVALKKALGE